MKLSDIFNSKLIRFAVAGSLGVKFLSAIFAFVNGIILARILNPADFGIYILAFTTVTILSVPIALGFPELIIRYIPKYQVNSDLSAIKGLLIRSNKMAFLTLFITFTLVAILYFFWWKHYPSEIVLTFWIAFLLMPLLVFGTIRAAALRGLKFVVLGQLPDTLLRNLFFSLLLGAFYFFEYNISPSTAMMLHVIAAAIAFLAGYAFLKVKLLNDLRDIKATYSNREWMHQAIPYSITECVSIVKGKSIAYILAFFANLESVAIFEVAMRGATLVSFTLGALNSAISPFLASAFEKKNLANLQRIVTMSNRIVFLFSLPIALIFIFGGEVVVTWLFGENYALSYVPLVIICLAQLVNAMAGAAGPVLNMTGYQKLLSRNQLQMMALSLVISIPLVVYYDVIGAALTFSLVLIVQNILLVWIIRTRLKINTTIF